MQFLHNTYDIDIRVLYNSFERLNWFSIRRTQRFLFLTLIKFFAWPLKPHFATITNFQDTPLCCSKDRNILKNNWRSEKGNYQETYFTRLEIFLHVESLKPHWQVTTITQIAAQSWEHCLSHQDKDVNFLTSGKLKLKIDLSLW